MDRSKMQIYGSTCQDPDSVYSVFFLTVRCMGVIGQQGDTLAGFAVGKQHMGEMYEVLRFIEHGSQCRQSMDYVQGTILIYYLRDNPQMDKSVLFGWFMQLGTGLDQYRRCRRGQPYRYLNPYSILVSEEGRMLLLDPDAPENEFVRKKMQQRAVRAHFVKPVVEAGRTGTESCDLFGFGRTVQFMLACIRVSPELTRREERRLLRFIDHCTVNEKKRYQDVREAMGDLPVFSEKDPRVHGKRGPVCLGVAAVLLLLMMSFGSIRKEEESEPMTLAEAAGREEGQQDAVLSDLVEDTSEALDSALLENTTRSNREILLSGRKLELKLLQSLAAVYEREELTEDAVRAYGRLIEIEEREKMIEEAGIRKMQLEAKAGMQAQAVLTGEAVLEKIGESRTVAQLIREYSAPESGEVQTDAGE